MLKVLRQLPPSERVRLLNAAAQLLVPRPRLAGDPELQGSEVINQLLREAREELRLPLGEDSPTIQRLILELISKELSQQLLPRDQVGRVRERVGPWGGLDYRAYQIKMGGQEEAKLRRRGALRDEEVLNAVSAPDAVQHMPPVRDDDIEEVSLFADTKGGGRDINTILVEAARKGAILTVSNAWRVFHADVNFEGVSTPLDLLRAFAATFGKVFRIGDRAPTTLVEYEAIPFEAVGGELRVIRALKAGRFDQLFQILDLDPNEEILSTSRVRVSGLNVLQVQLHYIVSITRYFESLRGHGINVQD